MGTRSYGQEEPVSVNLHVYSFFRRSIVESSERKLLQFFNRIVILTLCLVTLMLCDHLSLEFVLSLHILLLVEDVGN